VWYEFRMNSPKLLTPVSDADLVGLHWADQWLTGTHTGRSKGRATTIERNRKPFLFPNLL
jgi:hypothetical protein